MRMRDKLEATGEGFWGGGEGLVEGAGQRLRMGMSMIGQAVDSAGERSKGKGGSGRGMEQVVSSLEGRMGAG